MVKLGRNDRCHCGSGKKYKKCCMEKDKELAIAQQVQMIKESNVMSAPLLHLSYEEVNEFSTDEIIGRLEDMGIPFEKETFLEDINKFYSAEELSENWFEQYNVTATGRMKDFPWLSAWILWERLAPVGILAMEQLSDLLERGYEYLDENDSVPACDEWLKMWEGIKYRIDPAHKNLDYLDKHYGGSFFIRNVVQDLENELHNAGLSDPDYFDKRIIYCQEFCNYFPEEDELIVHNMRRAIADSYGMLGKYDKAEKEFEQLAVDFPNNLWSFIGWADLLFLEKKSDFHRAKELYEKALVVTKDKMDKHTIRERLGEVNKAL